MIRLLAITTLLMMCQGELSVEYWSRIKHSPPLVVDLIATQLCSASSNVARRLLKIEPNAHLMELGMVSGQAARWPSGQLPSPCMDESSVIISKD